MKYFLLFIILTLISCNKDTCQKCTRTWSYHSYRKYSTGQIVNEQTFAGVTESFYECDKESQEAAEKGETTHSETPVNGSQYMTDIVDGTASCSCN